MSDDLYSQLFGKDHIKDGDVINYAEHGRTGGTSTGQGFKFYKQPEEKVIVDEASGTITYIGTSSIGADTSADVWQIIRVEETGTLTSVTQAEANDNYVHVWDDRVSLSYS